MATAEIFGIKLENWYQKALFSIVAAIWSACLIAIFVLVLSWIALLVQTLAPRFGYQFTVTDELSKAVITVGGAVGVALVALFGVYQQNLSAERRHKVDSSLALRKEIFLGVADAMEREYKYLLSFAKIDEIQGERDSDRAQKKAQDRVEIIRYIGSAFFRAQIVGSSKTICAMIDTNEAWFRAIVDIQRVINEPRWKDTHDLLKIAEIQTIATGFMRKLWEFNILARKEINSAFDNDDAYFSAMDERYARVPAALKELLEDQKTVSKQ